jgi:hypothetical protein
MQKGVSFKNQGDAPQLLMKTEMITTQEPSPWMALVPLLLQLKDSPVDLLRAAPHSLPCGNYTLSFCES